MSRKPTVTEVARNFADHINRVAFRGERFTLMRGNKPVAELQPVPAGGRLGELQGILAALPRLSEQEACELARDLDAAATELDRRPLHDPWES